MKKTKKIFIFFFVFCATFMSGAFLKVNAALVAGYLWGGTEQISDGTINGNETGVGWIGMSRVDVPIADGNIFGYGWSENIGWIDFEPQNNCGIDYMAASCVNPDNNTTGVSRSGNILAGWARIVSIAQASVGNNSGGWAGWIKMNNVSIDGVTGQMSGYAWSDELGWLDFSGAKIDLEKVLNISLVAVPNACVGCGSLNFILTATRENTSTTSGDIVYEFDCEGDGTYESSYTTANVSQTQSCATSSSVIAGVRMVQEGVVATKTANVAIVPVSCGNGVIEGGEQCDDGANNGICPTSSCSVSCANSSCSNDYNWIEVAP